MADDKDNDIPDPWAALEAAGEGDAKEEFAFSFDGLGVDADESHAPASAFEDVAEANVAEESPERAFQQSDALEDQIADVIDAEPEAFVAEAVVEDDIAGWLAEPTAVPQGLGTLPELAAETEFAEAAEGFVEEAAAVAEEDASSEVVSFPLVGPPAVMEEGAETISFADATESDEAFAELESDDADLEPAAVLAMGGSQVAQVASKPVAKKKTGLGILGPILGGLLSLPIVFSILLGLLWGTGRDPIGMRSWLPSFLVPARDGGSGMRDGQLASATPPSLDNFAASVPSGDRGEDAAGDPVKGDAASMPETEDQPALDEVVKSESAPKPAGAEEPLPTPEIAFDPPMVTPPTTPSIPAPQPLPLEPTPLDLSALEAAVADALSSMDMVADSHEEEPIERRRALVAWYKNLARVGAELAMLETVAADSGQPLDETPAPVMTLYDRLGSAGGLAPDLKRLCRNWVDYAKRPADGVLLVGMLEEVRQVGPFWYASVSLEQVDGSLREVSLISRREPRADPGDRVAVAGVVFSEDMVWAADCGRLAAVAAVEDDPF